MDRCTDNIGVSSWGVKQGDNLGPFSVLKKWPITYGNNSDSWRNSNRYERNSSGIEQKSYRNETEIQQ